MRDGKRIRWAIVDWAMIAFLPLNFVLALVLAGALDGWRPPIESWILRVSIWFGASVIYLIPICILAIRWHRE